MATPLLKLGRAKDPCLASSFSCPNTCFRGRGYFGGSHRGMAGLDRSPAASSEADWYRINCK